MELEITMSLPTVTSRQEWLAAREEPDETAYQLASSAQPAGLRACQSCRPYRLSQTVDGYGSELVCRAVRMIVAGALDHDNEAGLAARLGLSGRHLRRLFKTHVGFTPGGLARSCRVFFARRLLVETNISVTDIAYMAGFGSVRQFNRDCASVFRATPIQLRARRWHFEWAAANGGMTLQMSFAGPLDWEALSAFLAQRAVPGVEEVDGRSYRRTIVVEEGPGLLELEPGGRDQMQLRLHLPYLGELMHLAVRARRIVSLDCHVMQAAESLKADAAIEPLLAARPGVRVPGAWDPFEVGVAAIASQGRSLKESRELLGRLVASHGSPVLGLERFRLTHTFPSPAVLADPGIDLRAAGLPADLAMTIQSYAAAVEQGLLRRDGSLSCDQLVSSISAVPGVSANSAQYLALRMGQPNAFPAEDAILRNVLGAYGPAISQRWHPWRAYAAAHIWAAA
jgi:AraC family transcriptional regulator, regulatory protein of adaptative response / DNA-3-methyladenine glycosylase II